jgi:hypothetical protein
MAYETLLNVPASIVSVDSYTINSTSVTGSIVLDAANTTLGSILSNEVPKVVFSLGKAGAAASLSATSITFTFSAATPLISNSYTGTLVESRFASNSAIFTIAFPTSPDLATTTLSFSGNGSTVVLNPASTSTLDNFFYVNDAGVIRTTAGHARLVQYLG